jgi:carboxyl-terminal processing protease
MGFLFAARRTTWFRVAALTVGAALLSPLVWAEPTGPTQSDRHVTVAVTSLLRREHLTKHALDDEISARCGDGYLKLLDPWKLYFYQSDIDAFNAFKTELDDMAKKGDVSFAHTVYKTFLERIDERVQMVEELLNATHDFTLDEEMPVDKDQMTWAKTPAEARERWRKRIKYDLLSLKADKSESDKPEEKSAVDKLRQRYRSFAKRMRQTSNEELLEMYLTSFTSSFDPHTSYMSPATVENFEIAMRLELEGIGAALQSVDGYTVVNKIVPGGAAEKDGRLKVEDKIVAVGQGEDASGEMVDIVDMKLSDVVKMVRGKENTKVRLAVVSVGSPEKKILTITRAKIELTDSEAKSEIFEAGRKSDGTAYRVGVIDLPSFYMDMAGARRGLPDFKSTTRDVRLILDDFNKKGVDAVVLDLRRNGGGSLTEAINTTGLFIGEGPVVQVKDADGRIQPYFDLDAGIAWAGPLVVVTSKFSASASEILAGAIQDYGRGLIVGDHATHGKGTVQSLLDLGQQLFRIPNAPPMGSLKITMQQFYRPSGESTQKRGVLADVELPSLTTHLDVAEADLDYPIPFDKVEPLNFKRYGYVTQTLGDQLRRLSEERCNSTEKFQTVRKNITRYLEQKARKTVTLNEEKFLAERADLNAEKEEEKKIEELNNGKKSIERDFYLDEVLAITVDYLNLHQIARAN